MTHVVARIRILPAEADSNLDDIIKALKIKIPHGMELNAHVKEPIAFGLHAIVGDFLMEDKEGQMDKLEESIKNTAGVGEIEVITISRKFVKSK